MTEPSSLPVSKLYKAYAVKSRKRSKLKKECCQKYLKKKGKYCDGCPTLYALSKHAGRDF